MTQPTPIRRSQVCAECGAVHFPSDVTSAQLCTACSSSEASEARSAFEAKVYEAAEHIDAGRYFDAIRITEDLIVECYARFQLDMAARLEAQLPGLRSAALVASTGDHAQ